MIKDNKLLNFIVEGEAVAFDRDTNKNFSFYDTVKRKRKHNISSISE